MLEATAEKKEKLRIAKSKGGIVVKGIHDVAVRFSKCCNPIPGDEIVGYVTRGRGVTIHRTDCINVMNMNAEDRNRLIDAEMASSRTGYRRALYCRFKYLCIQPERSYCRFQNYLQSVRLIFPL